MFEIIARNSGPKLALPIPGLGISSSLEVEPDREEFREGSDLGRV